MDKVLGRSERAFVIIPLKLGEDPSNEFAGESLDLPTKFVEVSVLKVV